MLCAIRKSKLISILWVIFALHLLNISVDNVDPAPSFIPEDLSFNDQESIVEIFIEKILGFTDAMEEYDDNDSSTKSKSSIMKFELFETPDFPDYSLFIAASKTKCFPDFTPPISFGFYSLFTPPPIT